MVVNYLLSGMILQMHSRKLAWTLEMIVWERNLLSTLQMFNPGCWLLITLTGVILQVGWHQPFSPMSWPFATGGAHGRWTLSGCRTGGWSHFFETSAPRVRSNLGTKETFQGGPKDQVKAVLKWVTNPTYRLYGALVLFLGGKVTLLMWAPTS